MIEICSYDPIDLYACFDMIFSLPEDFMEESRKYREELERRYAEKQNAVPVFYVTDETGTEYFYHGSSKIKVSEHFSNKGKTIETLLEDVIQYTANGRSAGKLAACS